MRFLMCVAISAIGMAGALGCGGTKLRVVGYPQADVYVNMPGAKEYTYIGRTAGQNEMEYVYELPKSLENTKLPVLVKTAQGSWKYTVFTDRSQTIHYPPEGATLAPPATAEAGKLGGKPPAAAAKPPAAASKPAGGEPAAAASPANDEKPPATSPADEPPSAEISPN